MKRPNEFLMLKTTLEQWRMFKAVVEHGGFNQAAEAVHKSQSTIHHAVHKLEESLDLKLLEVKGRKANLTPAGELMLRRVDFLMDEVAKIEAVANSLSTGVETNLKIAVDQVFPQEILYSVLGKVSAEFPQLRIELVETVLSGANELLQQGSVDLVVSPTPLLDIFNEELCPIEFIAVANPSHALHNLDRKLTYEDLKAYRQIVIRDSAQNTSADHGWLGANQRWTVSHMRTSIDIVSKGLGYAWLPTTHILPLLEVGSLKALPLEHGLTRTVQIFLMFADGDKLGQAARSFIGELRYATSDLPVNTTS